MLEINKIYHGNCMDLFKELPNESIDCVITSPPYWQLRDYKWDGQWGLEPTFTEYLEHLWEMMNEVYRVLKPTGTVWINLGDSYGTQSGNSRGITYKTTDATYLSNIEAGAELIKQPGLHKCLLLIPHRFAIGCIDRGWTVRNDIIWAKRNGMPESVTDRFSKKHEYIFFMTKQEEYYFDLESVKDRSWTKDNSVRNRDETKLNNTPGRTRMGGLKTNGYDTKNPGSVSDFWDIPTQQSSDEHFAAYNDKLIGKPIVAGCPKGGVILDPFCGTATTGCRALELGRNFIGFEGSEKFVKMGTKNILPYLQQTKMF